jgi:glyoxylase I family protein
MAVRYAHTNVIANDWRRLVEFYVDVFGCEPVGPERDQSGAWLEAATGVPAAHLRGRHLLLPGHGPSGPTLEIYTYEQVADRPQPVANRAGYGHLAFEVDDVSSKLDAVLAHGGGELGTIATTTVPGVGDLRVVYARDPEGNILELQSWRRRH